MALKQLTPEQIQTMSLEEKDEWWLKNVFRGDMPQLTWRSAITGMLLGGFLSLTNLYIGARTGWSLGVGITSVILAFAIFKVLSKLGAGREMTVLENNAMQSIATSAGYMNSPLFTSLAAYSMITATIVPMYQAGIWVFTLALLGVLFAFPMKKRFINDDQLPFPEGMAAGVVMDSLHTGSAKEGMLKAKLLVGGGLASALVEVLRSET
ncbi:MAG: OPT/YSL family transporter, partial [Polyangiaceae bacterium]|nr:OPT/YSL family transporter [Polyangiaceae bacterium]